MVNKTIKVDTRIIDKALGFALEKEGFKYIGKKKIGDIYWLYGRQDGEWLQCIYIVKHAMFNHMWVEIDEKKMSEKLWDSSGYGLSWFINKEDRSEIRKIFNTDEELLNVLEELKELIFDYGIYGLKKLRRPRYKYCVTKEMERKVYEERMIYLEELEEKYQIRSLREHEILFLLVDLLKECRGKSMEEFNDKLLKLSVLWGENIVCSLKNYQWEWDNFYKKAILMRNQKEYVGQIMGTVFDAWADNIEIIKRRYNYLFVEKRKEDKTSERWKLELQEKKYTERNYMDNIVSSVMGKMGFRYEEWQTKNRGWLFIYQEGGMAQKLWVMHDSRNGEMWIKIFTSKGTYIEIRNIREGLSPYKYAEYCHQNDSIWFPKIMDDFLIQIETEVLLMLKDEDEYLLSYDLTPEMEKSQFYQQKELLEALSEKYPFDKLKKEDLPDFVKRILWENDGKSMEEFGTTLLGLGVLLGNTSIQGKRERHWLYDELHAACIVTSGDEVHGIDPAFALNYAWQKKKPENVDRLCEDLFGDWEWIKEDKE